MGGNDHAFSSGTHARSSLESSIKKKIVSVFDATAKLPSGILSGNGNQYGDFDECLGVEQPVAGKYCLASLQLTVGGDGRMGEVDRLVHSGHYIKSNLTDNKHLERDRIENNKSQSKLMSGLELELRTRREWEQTVKPD
ncbi:hypothetical protein EVAR_42996_1 [Eumeta japonica]|uniref:Nose resistant-to-fluoxetine protein N-terminal domain-containing protein n=1 Tax=Eumeta variegata TaxID=151549 RepID=A0A4C1WA56_EUMVA|nr:hypothetical protein EVAR_42996_1 [Eumeta japonica]